MHLARTGAGTVVIDYRAALTLGRGAAAVTEADRLLYARPSRYAPSDALAGYATATFGTAPQAEQVAAVGRWVSRHLRYLPGASRGTDGAVETLLAGAGVCRDYTHLTIGLLRALDVPARLAAVYAPGCDPMDFHAVVEALVGDTWWVVDPTGLAPRTALVRIATGRDAADTAFLTNHGGAVVLHESTVLAIVDGALPVDDGTADVTLP